MLFPSLTRVHRADQGLVIVVVRPQPTQRVVFSSPGKMDQPLRMQLPLVSHASCGGGGRRRPPQRNHWYKSLSGAARAQHLARPWRRFATTPPPQAAHTPRNPEGGDATRTARTKSGRAARVGSENGE